MVRERLGLWERGRAHEGFTDTEADLGEPGSPVWEKFVWA